VVDLGVQLGLVNKAGAWYSYGTERIGQGKKNACEYLADNPAMGAEIEALIRAKLLDSGADAESEDKDDNVTPISG
jgi:recombination protein RecA